MAASFELNQPFPFSIDEIQKAILRAFNQLNAHGIGWSADGLEVRAEIGIAASTWGQIVTITLVPGRKVTVHSKCAVRGQMIDWGKNEDNCRAIIAEMIRSLN
jgi:hypothetical protein